MACRKTAVKRVTTRSPASATTVQRIKPAGKGPLPYLCDLDQFFCVTGTALDDVVDASDVLHRDSNLAAPGLAVFVRLTNQRFRVVLTRTRVRRDANLQNVTRRER